MSIAIITPRMPPALDGIGDYCYQLWQHWSPGKRPTNFIVLESAQKSREFCPEINIHQIEPDENTLVSTLNNLNVDIVFLQYVGYGYDINGAPFWLVEALDKWLSQNTHRKLVTMFHESIAGGMPWQRVFWFQGKQKQCINKLLHLSSKIATSCQPNKESLLRINAGKPIEIIPIGCSFPVTASPEKNWQQLLIFGKEFARLRAIRLHKNLLKALVDKGLIEKLVLAGQLGQATDQTLALIKQLSPNLPVTTHYNFSSDAIAQEIRESGLSLMHTQSTHLLKSTSFHLAAKLGQVAITIDTGEPEPPFQSERHLLSYKNNLAIERQLADKQQLQTISSQVLDLAYSYLDWEIIAQRWQELFENLQ